VHQDAVVIRILLVDRQEMFRDGLRRLLESEPGFSVVGGAGHAHQALQLIDDLDPDVLLLDLALRGTDTLDILRTLAKTPHRVRTIGLTASVDKEVLVAALEYGARGVILKESGTAMLFESVRKVVNDQYWVGREDVAHIVERLRHLAQQQAVPAANRFKLTRRQIDIVAAVVAGESNKGIADRLSLSEDTVKHHVSNVFDKLGVFSRLELAVFAINHKLVREVEVA
jgi:two-component system, NarL family, nitrate/nitrite response regulator NarL